MASPARVVTAIAFHSATTPGSAGTRDDAAAGAAGTSDRKSKQIALVTVRMSSPLCGPECFSGT